MHHRWWQALNFVPYAVALSSAAALIWAGVLEASGPSWQTATVSGL